MRRGTTPTLTMKLKTRTGQSVDTAILTGGYITFQQNGRTVLEKKLEECKLTDSSIAVDLTQEETLRFNDNSVVRIQGKFKSQSGKIIPTKIKHLTVDEILNEEVL